MSQTPTLQRDALAQFQSTFSADSAKQRVLSAVEAVRKGIPVVVLDDFDRENEADLILAAECLTEASMAQLIRDGSGIVCLCLKDEDVQRLELPPMVQTNESAYGTAFTVSIEARHGVSTGVSAKDRVTTIQAAIAPNATAHDLVRPGHVFPLRAHPGGVLARQGHTEGSVCLAELAGLRPMGVLCELMNPDGTMMRGEEVFDYAHKLNLPVLAIADLVRYQQEQQAQA